MRRDLTSGAIRATVALQALLLTAVPVSWAQDEPELPRPSPLARVEQRVGVTDFAVEYSSPGVKDRVIWGGLVPYDELWRTGANRATTIEVSEDFTFAGKAVAAGKYSVFTIPDETSWTVILNGDTDLGGTRGYSKKNDVARVKVTPQATPKRERMTFLFSNTTDDSTRLDLVWDELLVPIPIEVATDDMARANIEETLDDAWRPHFAAARWLLDSDGDLTQALAYIDTSIAVKATWWNHWVKAQILAEQGNPAEAAVAARGAQTLGDGDEIYEGFFKGRIEKAIADWTKS